MSSIGLSSEVFKTLVKAVAVSVWAVWATLTDGCIHYNDEWIFGKRQEAKLRI